MNLWLINQVMKKVKPIKSTEIDYFIWYFCAYLVLLLPTAFVIWHFFLR